ncbi:MAG TPA: TonB-dependent receptor [Candidatus Omnitrophota bacterium]|nr:TonB-dependent receptor [Candidatus Omnitrophota bacterium]HPD85254.1 TonB-dependent receptor [Candidatus Omnitrophota bacterium]HRZ04245.1 TonB-dependent receptor [Candidatus Omnitrophota bacterium]
MKKLLSIITILILAAAPAFAQTLTESNADYDDIALDKIVVTTSRLAQYGYKVPSNVSVIGEKDIAASNAKTVSEILGQQLGINIYDNNTYKSAIVDMRGFGDTAARNVLVLINDRKVNSIDMSGPDLLQIPLGSVERIEVIRGGGSVLYGDNAVGGVINIITKEGKGPAKLKSETRYGSYDLRSEALELSGGYKNGLSYYFYSKYHDDHGYRDNNHMLSKDYDMRLGYDYSNKLSIDLIGGWHQDKYGLPGGLSDTQLSTLGRRGTANPEDFATSKDRSIQSVFNFTPWPEDQYYGELSLGISYRNKDGYDSFNSYGPYNTKRSIDTAGITTKYVFNRPVFNKEVNFVTGIDYYDSENDILGSGDNTDDVTISKTERGFFGHLEYEIFKKTFASAGARYQQAKYAFSQRNGVCIDEKRKPDVWVYDGGMKYEYSRGSNIFFNIQRTFRFLATDEWYNSANYPGFSTPGLNLNLKQQTGMQYEVGVKHNLKDITVVSITPYLMNLDNEIFYDPNNGNSNYDKTRRIGVEAEQRTNLLKIINFSPLSRIELVTNYTFQNAEFNKGPNDNKQIPMVPQHQVTASLDTELRSGLGLSLTSRYVGSRYAINDVQNTTPKAKDYLTLDSKLTYKWRFLELYAGINNIFNAYYSNYVAKSTSSSTKSYFPAPGRNFILGMDLTF